MKPPPLNYPTIAKLLTLVCFLTLLSCSLFKASPSKKNLFLTHPEKVIELRDRAPFNGVGYLDPVKVDELHQTARQIVIMPVRTDLLEAELLKEIPDDKKRAQRTEEATEIARYFTDRIKASILAYKKYPYELVDKTTAPGFIVEFALVELQPTTVTWNVVGTIASLFVPGGGAIGRAATGAIAFEAQIRDGATNEVLVEFRDRESDKTSPFSIKDFEEYGNIRRAVDEWADQYAELSATARTHRVSDSLGFTLNPL